jgi:hypothetical protein
MKKITLSFTEFYLFKEIANFIYEFTVNKDCVIINCDAKLLEELGY